MSQHIVAIALLKMFLKGCLVPQTTVHHNKAIIWLFCPQKANLTTFKLYQLALTDRLGINSVYKLQASLTF